VKKDKSSPGPVMLQLHKIGGSARELRILAEHEGVLRKVAVAGSSKRKGLYKHLRQGQRKSLQKNGMCNIELTNLLWLLRRNGL